MKVRSSLIPIGRSQRPDRGEMIPLEDYKLARGSLLRA